jgi:hypothetical protein
MHVVSDDAQVYGLIYSLSPGKPRLAHIRNYAICVWAVLSVLISLCLRRALERRDGLMVGAGGGAGARSPY